MLALGLGVEQSMLCSCPAGWPLLACMTFIMLTSHPPAMLTSHPPALPRLAAPGLLLLLWPFVFDGALSACDTMQACMGRKVAST